MNMKVNKLHIALWFSVILAGCSSGENTSSESAKHISLNVKTEEVIQFKGSHTVGYSGVVVPKKNTPLSFSVPGTVSKIAVEEGQQVNKGQLLAQLNPSTMENTYQMVFQKLQQAQDAYDRLKPMHENGTLPEIKWVEVETGLSQAKSATSIAKKGLDDTKLYAFTAGVIGKKSIQEGENVFPNITVFELFDISKVYVKIPVPEDEISSFKKGDQATITVGAISKTINGIVIEIGVSADIFSHSYPVRLEVDNSDLAIKPGMVCTVNFATQNKATGVLISNKAMQQDLQGTQFVYVIENNTAQKRAVKTIALIDQKILVSGNLKEGDKIIVAGQDKLRQGSQVNIIK